MLKLSVEKPKRNYESVIILHPDATEEEQKTFFKKQNEIIKSYKGETNHIDTWGKRKLANAIDKIRMGTYFHSTFVAEPECIAELERTMRINDKVLRFQHTKLDERTQISKHLENFRDVIKKSVEREQEKERAAQKRMSNKRERR